MPPAIMKDVLAQVQRIELHTKQLVDGLLAGNFHSIFKGQGMEFSEIREYRPGDDIRNIDWNVTARYDHPYVKEFIEERDLYVYVVLDVSGSAEFGNTVYKQRKALDIAATLIFAAVRNNDNIALVLATDSVELFLPPRKGRRHAIHLLRKAIEHHTQSKKTDLKNVLSQLGTRIKRKSSIFLLSDFVSEPFSKELSALANQHDVIAMRILDKREQQLPDVGLIELEDPETGEQLLVDTSDETFRTKYAHLVSRHEQQLSTLCAKNKTDLLTLDTEKPYSTSLHSFFSRRRRF